MPEDTIFDPTDKGILRPNTKPLQKKGDIFQPMQLPDFGWEITLLESASPDDPITLFTMYYIPEIIDLIVQKTNDYMQTPQDESCPYARANDYVTNRLNRTVKGGLLDRLYLTDRIGEHSRSKVRHNY
jgi:hypothetical protein